MKLPFIINSNYIEYPSEISTLDKLKNTVAGNIGNSYITYALMKLLYGKTTKLRSIKNFFDYDYSNSDSLAEHLNGTSSSIIILLQDQLTDCLSYTHRLDSNSLLKLLSKIKIPICAIGLGANSPQGYDSELHRKIDKDFVNLLKFIASRTHEIGVRGAYTAEVLSKLGINNINITGCPTWFETGRDRILSKNYVDEPKFLLDSPCQYHSSITEKCHSYILQDEWDLIHAVYFRDEKASLDVESPHEIMQGSKKFRFFSSIESWKSYIKGFDLVVGTRVHGAILAVNSGVPAIITSGDAGSAEMCELFGIPRYSGGDLKSLYKDYQDYNFSEINKNYNKLYSNFTQFLEFNDLLDPACAKRLPFTPQPELEKNVLELHLFKETGIDLHFHLPYYTPNSNGIKLLWEAAYQFKSYCNISITVFNRGEKPPAVIDSRLKSHIVEKHNSDAIVIYPDIIEGNPLGAKKVCRFLMGSRLLFEGREIKFGNNDLLIAYSSAIAPFLPKFNFNNTDLNSFYAFPPANKRHICVYYGKCRHHKINKRKLSQILSGGYDIKVITRRIPDSHSQLFKLLNESIALITFDPLTNLAYEASLLGVPTIFADTAFKEAFKNYDHVLHGYYYIDEVDSLDAILKESIDLRERAWKEYYSVQRELSTKASNVLQVISSHFKKSSTLNPDVKKYTEYEKLFFNGVWRKSPLYLCGTYKSVIWYHVLNASLTSKAIIAAFALPFIPFIFLLNKLLRKRLKKLKSKLKASPLETTLRFIFNPDSIPGSKNAALDSGESNQLKSLKKNRLSTKIYAFIVRI